MHTKGRLFSLRPDRQVHTKLTGYNICGVNDLDAWKAGKIASVEGEYRTNPMNLHRRHDPGIMSDFARNSMLHYQGLPQVISFLTLGQDREQILQWLPRLFSVTQLAAKKAASAPVR